MKEPVWVSIVINNYNYGRFLKDAIDSAINQTYHDVEVIVVDDGSTDESTDIIAEFGDKVIPILKKNGGQGSAFNAGFKASRGDIVIFLDSDDTLFPTAVTHAVGGFDCPAVAKVHWALWRVNASGEKTGGLLPRFPLIEGNLQEALVRNGPVDCGGPPHSPPTSGNAWSREFLNQVLPMAEAVYKSGADQYLFALVPLFGELRSLPEPEGCYRVHGSNDTLRPLGLYIDEYFVRFEHCCTALCRHIKNKGIEVDPATWKRTTWYHQIHTVMQDISSIVPPAVSFILVDDNFWRASDFGDGRRPIPFLERDNKYWGLPANDEHAIQELERLRQAGAGFIIFTWFSFWWLDYYAGMHDYLKLNYTSIMQSERLVVFAFKKMLT